MRDQKYEALRMLRRISGGQLSSERLSSHAIFLFPGEACAAHISSTDASFLFSLVVKSGKNIVHFHHNTYSSIANYYDVLLLRYFGIGM